MLGPTAAARHERWRFLDVSHIALAEKAAYAGRLVELRKRVKTGRINGGWPYQGRVAWAKKLLRTGTGGFFCLLFLVVLLMLLPDGAGFTVGERSLRRQLLVSKADAVCLAGQLTPSYWQLEM
jgi:hypothetical protein